MEKLTGRATVLEHWHQCKISGSCFTMRFVVWSMVFSKEWKCIEEGGTSQRNISSFKWQPFRNLIGPKSGLWDQLLTHWKLIAVNCSEDIIFLEEKLKSAPLLTFSFVDHQWYAPYRQQLSSDSIPKIDVADLNAEQLILKEEFFGYVLVSRHNCGHFLWRNLLLSVMRFCKVMS